MDIKQYKQLLGMNRDIDNSVYVLDGKFKSRICLSDLESVGHQELIWNINRFDEKDVYVEVLGWKQKQLDLGLKAAQEVIEHSFLSDVFLNRDGNYLEEGLYVDVSGKYPHAAIWAALVQTRIFYEFPEVANMYFKLREKGFSVDQSVVFCQVIFIDADNSLVHGTRVRAHGTTPSYGAVSVSLLKKYFVKGWDYIRSCELRGTSGAASFSQKVFQSGGNTLSEVNTLEELYQTFNGEHDA